MLVLSRKVGQKIAIGEDVVLVITRIAGNRVSLGIEAPEKLRVVRGELDRLPCANGAAQGVSEASTSPGSNAGDGSS
jgi:carbon storage regulator